MQGLNKMIGGLLGFLVAGPGGCLLGALIGHVFDKRLAPPEHSDAWKDFWTRMTQKSDDYQEKENPVISLPEIELKKAYEILGLSKDATPFEVKQAYRRAINRYHPDRLATKDLSSSQLKKAIQKAYQIKEAYELIRKTKNFPKSY